MGVLMMTMSYLKADCSPALDIVGDLAALKGSGDGPPPPPGDVVNVVACSVRLSANWDQSDALFAGLISGADSVMKIPLERFDYEVYYNPDVSTMEPYQMNTRHTSYVEGAELFDNRQFEISNAEAAGMDVRQRHVLECGADLLFQIGITKKSANRQVYHAGCSVGTDGYEWPFVDKGDMGAMGNSSTALAITANRFSFVFNFRGLPAW